MVRATKQLLVFCIGAITLAHGAQVFISSPHDGNFGGLSGADAFCKREAVAAVLESTSWCAILSDSTVSAGDRCQITQYPLYRTDGIRVSRTNIWETHENGIDKDQFGQAVEQGTSMWTATDQAGRTALPSPPLPPCNDWRSASSAVRSEIGRVSPGGGPWALIWNEPCNELLRVYCVDTSTAPPTTAPTNHPTTSPTGSPTTTTPTTSPTTSPTATPTSAPTSAPIINDCVQIFSTTVPSFLCGCKDDDQSGGVNYRTGVNITDPDDPCYLSSTQRRNIATVIFIEEQKEEVDILLAFGAVLAVLTIAVIVVSKCVCQDKKANYLTVIQNSLSVFDFVSDVALLSTLLIIFRPEGSFAAQNIYAWVNVGFVASVFTYNLCCSVAIICSERGRKQAFREYCEEHPVVVGLCVLMSPVKPNFILLLDSGLYQSHTEIFKAPLPLKLRTKYNVVVWGQLIGEDMFQMTLVMLVQQRYLGGWTALNIMAFTVSAVSLCLSIAITSMHNVKAYKHKKAKSMEDLKMKALETRDSHQVETRDSHQVDTRESHHDM